MLDERTLQAWLKTEGVLTGEVDGVLGPQSRQAIDALLSQKGVFVQRAWSTARKRLAAEQLFLREHSIDVGAIDGLAGPQTQFAFEEWHRKQRDVEPEEHEVAHQPSTWPRQKDVPGFYGGVGEHQVSTPLPYAMKLAWDTSTVIHHIQLHEKVSASAQRVLSRVLGIYGSRIPELGLDLFGGSLNVRKMRGGSAWSMHAWGIAIDIDPDHNQLHWGRDKARFGQPIYKDFLDAWYIEGWISLGRERNFDFMHVQAARL